MRAALILVVVWWCALESTVAEGKGKVAAFQLAGHEYVPLQSWAEDNQFAFARKDEEVKLSTRWASVSCKVNSLRIDLNGINLFLAFPIVLHQGTVCIAQRDIDRTLRPILFPTRTKPKASVRTVALAAGHGGKDCGYQVGSYQEKKFALLLTKELQELMIRVGLKPVLVRSSDNFVELEDRPKVAKHARADLYLELHYNCAGQGNTESKGVEVYCLTPAGANSTNGGTDHYPALPGNRQDERNVLLAYQVQRALVESVGLVDRGVRRARFVVLRDAQMPAVLVEAGFMSHPEEMRKIQDPVFRRQTAQAIVDGILAYKRLVER